MEERAVAVMNVLADTRHAFDGVARDYDRSNAQNRTICAMRERLWQTVDRFVTPGSSLLDLGCGPGCDVERFAARGYRVTGVDWSPAMVQEARHRVRQAGTNADVRHVGIHELDRLAPTVFDAAYSDLGPLNCVTDLSRAATLIGDRLRPGGLLIASVIGRVCPWEIALYSARRQWARARVRYSPAMTAVPLEGRTVWTRYYTPESFERAFLDAGFHRVSLRALGLFVPPPYMDAFAGRHPALVDTLQRLDDRVGDWPGMRSCGDHFLIVMRKS